MHRLLDRVGRAAGGLLAAAQQLAAERLQVGALAPLGLGLGGLKRGPRAFHVLALRGDPSLFLAQPRLALFQLLEQCLGLGFLAVEPRACVLHDRRGQAEPLGHLQRQAAPRRSE
ncbi:MAG: hypothetical protein DMF82_24410, partial [Acidobacteria bacterium]